MTKINKLGKSTFVIAILSLVLVAVLAFGGTYAYFSATTAKTTGTIKTGTLTIGNITDEDNLVTSNVLTIATKVAQPNQVLVDDTFKAVATTNISYYTRVKFEVIVATKDGAVHKNTDATKPCGDHFDNAIDALQITTTNEGWDAGRSTGDATKSSAYYYKLAPTAVDVAEAAAQTAEEFAVKVQAKSILGKYDGSADGCTFWMDATITINITFEVLQADYLVDGTTKADADGFADGTTAEAAWTTALTGAQSAS